MSVDSSTNYFGFQLVSPLAAAGLPRIGQIDVLRRSKCRGAKALLGSSSVARQAPEAAPQGSSLTSDNTCVKRYLLLIEAGDAASVVAASRGSSLDQEDIEVAEHVGRCFELATKPDTQSPLGAKMKPDRSLRRRIPQRMPAVRLRCNRYHEPDGSREGCNMKWTPETTGPGNVECEIYSTETERRRLTSVSRAVPRGAYERLWKPIAVDAVFVTRVFGLLRHGVEHLREIPAEMIRWLFLNRYTKATSAVGTSTCATYNKPDLNKRANCALPRPSYLSQGQRFQHLAVNCHG